MRGVAIALAIGLCWIAGGALLHFVVFPEPVPDPTDVPRRGSVVRLPRGSTFVYRQTAAETDGALFEADWTGAPGAGVARHSHPSQEVRLRVSEGSLRVVAGGAEHRLGPGEEFTIEAGVEHLWENAAAVGARGTFQLRPAGRADFVFVQLDRAFGGEAGGFATAIQTFILIGTHGQHTRWPIEMLRFLVAPTARLFGIRSYYPSTDPAPASSPQQERSSRVTDEPSAPS